MLASLHTIGVIVQDMTATLASYRALGISIPEGAEREENVDVMLASWLVLGFLSEKRARGADPSFVTPLGQSMNLQFLCDTPKAVDDVHAALTAAGYASHTAPWDAFWGQRFARVTDPDGRVVNFFAELS